MKRKLGIIVLLLISVMTVWAGTPRFHNDRVIFKVTPSANFTVDRDGALLLPTGDSSLDELLSPFATQRIEPLYTHDPISLANPAFHELGMDHFYRLIVPREKLANFNPHTFSEALTRLSSIEAAEAVAIRELYYTPSDWNLSGRNMWGLASMRCQQAWDLQRGDSTILAVTIDTGVDFTHPDLVDNLQVNNAEDINHDGRFTAADSNGIDDDNNGFIDDVIGWDFVNVNIDSSLATPTEEYRTEDNFPSDVHGHGTHVCGTIAGRTDNGAGVPSASFNVKTLAIRCGYAYGPNAEAGGGAGEDAWARAIQYAVNRGARVISISFGGPAFSLEGVAILYARANNCLVFAAAGNSNTSQVSYPAAFPGVMAVAALQGGNVRASFSNFGSWVDIAAPGTGIWSTMVNNQFHAQSYVAWDGTSMASPNAAAVAALLLSSRPSMTDDELENILLLSAFNIDGINPGFANQLGAGAVDAYGALTLRATLRASRTVTSDTIYTLNSDTVRWISASRGGTLRIELSRNDTLGPWEVLAANAPDSGRFVWQVFGEPSADCRIRVSDADTTTIRSITDPFAILRPSLQIRFPNGGESYAVDARRALAWYATGSGAPVNIALNRDYPNGAWEPLYTNQTNVGAIVWTVTGPGTNTARLRIAFAGDSTIFDISDNHFSIIDVDAPEPAVSQLPERLAVSAFPNPANGDISLTLALPIASNASLAIYDVQGRFIAQLANSTLRAGYTTFRWQPRGAASGVYFAVVQTPRGSVSRKLVLLQ